MFLVQKCLKLLQMSILGMHFSANLTKATNWLATR